ncbi:MAG TPA: GNAT family N-acetyltransferase [Thermoplasmata archaeon]|nr:GNAT family N-acetyltransferase [Thermoplasmata archaeon]
MPSPLVGLRLPIKTRRLRLELPRASQVDEYVALLGDFEVSRWLLHVPYPYRKRDARRLIARARSARRGGSALILAVVDKRTGRQVGDIRLTHLDWTHRGGELGYCIGRPYWGNGYATEAASALVRVAFRQLRLHRLEACVFRGNRRSARLLTKLGFRREGTRREAFHLRGAWVDDIVFGLVRS